MRGSIGIVGGVGPYAGLELQNAILRHTEASRDQDYPPVISISAPHSIADRTEFLLGNTSVNPAYEIIKQINDLYSCGARYIGIPCNSAHAEKIFTVIRSGIRELKDVVLVNMIDETFYMIKNKIPDVKRIGVIATKGSYKSNLFTLYGSHHHYEIVIPDDTSLQDEIHNSIYDITYGIKALGYLHDIAAGKINRAFEFFQNNRINTVILGCTELSVVFKEDLYNSFTLIDPIDALAKKLLTLFQQNVFAFK